jgi:CubicO group peptidase (beta-lactamase class C family)
MTMSQENNYSKNIVLNNHSCPGYHYLFFNKDSILYEDIYGVQNIEQKLDVNQNTSFHAFSTTKTFTAVAIMQLIEQGHLKLDDPISKHLKNYSFSKDFSVKNLLSHQSGLANPIPLKWTHLKQDHDQFDYQHFSDALINKYTKVKRKPGTKYAYSNLNYIVLGRVIEVVTGKSYKAYIEDSILKPLSAENYIGYIHPNSNHASGYHPNKWLQNFILGFLLDRKEIMFPVSNKWNGFHPFYVCGQAYGGLFASPRAMMKYCQALFDDSNLLLSNNSIHTMLEAQPTSNGKSTNMALGWFKGKLDSYEYSCHAGGGGGYYTEIRIYPKLGVGSVIMMNSSGMKDERILDQLDKPLLNKNGLTN